jgi:hypothetical protein
MLGSVLGGAILGMLLAAVAASIDAAGVDGVVVWLVAATIAVYAVGELTGRPVWRPNTGRQVPEGLRRTPYVSATAFLFAADLAFGWSTQQRSPAFLVFCLVAVTTNAGLALAAGIGFGLLRGLTLVSGWRMASVEQLAVRFGPLQRRRRAMSVGTGVIALASSTLLLLS